MDEELRRSLDADLAKAMAMFCVRNTQLEDLHAGIVPVTRTGDYSDVTVIDADGRRIPWPEISHFDDDAMRDLMRQVAQCPAMNFSWLAMLVGSGIPTASVRLGTSRREKTGYRS